MKSMKKTGEWLDTADILQKNSTKPLLHLHRNINHDWGE